MPLLMSEYCLRVLRLFGRLPYQVLVYAGEPALQMEAVLNSPALSYSYRLIESVSWTETCYWKALVWGTI